MTKARIICIGQKMPSWVNEGVQAYSKRLRSSMPLDFIELPVAKRSKQPDSLKQIEKLKQKEAEQILSLLKPDDFVIALELTGELWTTEALADQLGQWRLSSRPLSFIIGGPDGLSQSCLQRANTLWSLSPLTLPHPMVRVVIAEQLYRAMSILVNHPYHK